LQDDRIHYSGQPVALIAARTWEEAKAAGALLKVTYEEEPPRTNFEEATRDATAPAEVWGQPPEGGRGDIQKGLAEAAAIVDETYITAMQHHVAMEPHATVAFWEGDQLTVHEPSTWVYGVRKTLAAWFSMPEEKIRVLQEFVGGSFGAKGPTWPHVALTCAAARIVNRPVRLELTRKQTFTSNGYRPEIRQHIRVGAKQNGSLTALEHEATLCTAVFDRRVVAPVTRSTPKLYACPHIRTSYRLGKLSLPGPFTMRGPGETPGQFAIECALDELAYKLNLDPIELRLRNETPVDPETGKPWSSRSLRECFRQGAERFRWQDRDPRPGSMRDKEHRVGMGMAAMIYDSRVSPTRVRVRLLAEGHVVLQTATCDQGTGSYTIFPEIAGRVLGIVPDRIRLELGDTNLPFAPISAGSQTTASVGSAVQAACLALRRKILSAASMDPMSPWYGHAPEHIPHQDDLLFEALKRTGQPFEEAEGTAAPTEEHKQHSCYSFGAQFAEVRIHAKLGELQVSRFVGVYGAGQIVNAKLAHSQLIGGIVWGIGMALMEYTVVDRQQGRMMNTNLSQYQVPVNADIHHIDAFFLEEGDKTVNPLGVKSVGEIGTIGTAAAIANAVYHATGKRIRNLPITVDKLL
jgi:xanthine dehydrogenase YagR molybdenum-binding subunit